ncbi:MAG: hypothetical protein ACP5KE_09460 [Candidatus Methanodesulfokora sp.]
MILWRSLASGGPDVEMIMFVPVAIAVESKRTLTAALDDLDQIIGYVAGSLYDAVILRLRNYPGEEELRKAEPLIRRGVGIVIGEDDYAPLGHFDRVLFSADLKMRGNVIEIFRRMGGTANLAEYSLNNIEDALTRLSSLRRFFQDGRGEEG